MIIKILRIEDFEIIYYIYYHKYIFFVCNFNEILRRALLGVIIFRIFIFCCTCDFSLEKRLVIRTANVDTGFYISVRVYAAECDRQNMTC